MGEFKKLLKVSDLEDVEGVADGEVPLEREGHDRQHGGVGGPGRIVEFWCKELLLYRLKPGLILKLNCIIFS